MSRYVPTLQQYAPPRLYDLEEMCERSGVLELYLLDEGQHRIRVSFSEHLGFRKAGESDALVTLDAIAATSQAGRSFYFVEDSVYLRWFIDQSHGIRRAESLVHMTIVTIDDVIDVITLEMPSITLL
jgi:hypothetical protein